MHSLERLQTRPSIIRWRAGKIGMRKRRRKKNKKRTKRRDDRMDGKRGGMPRARRIGGRGGANICTMRARVRALHSSLC